MTCDAEKRRFRSCMIAYNWWSGAWAIGGPALRQGKARRYSARDPHDASQIRQRNTESASVYKAVCWPRIHMICVQTAEVAHPRGHLDARCLSQNLQVRAIE
jgi:hypothetical protein